MRARRAAANEGDGSTAVTAGAQLCGEDGGQRPRAAPHVERPLATSRREQRGEPDGERLRKRPMKRPYASAGTAKVTGSA